MKLLQEIYHQGLFGFYDRFTDWRIAIQANAAPLLQAGLIDERYIAAVIKCVEDYGPYIVMMPNVAIPHSTDHAVGVNQPAIALMIVKQPVIFAEDDRDKDARLFFMVASKDSASHLKAIQDLCEVLDNEPLMEKLMTCNNEQELKALVDSL